MSYIHILHVIIIMKNLMQHNFSFFFMKTRHYVALDSHSAK